MKRKPGQRRHTIAKGLVVLAALVFFGWVLYQVPFVRELRVHVLARFGPRAVPSLCRALDDPDHKVRLAAIAALQAIGADAVPPLLPGLKDPNAEVRLQTCQALAYLGAVAHDAVPALVDALAD